MDIAAKPAKTKAAKKPKVDKNAKLVELAGKRVPRVVKQIANLGNLSAYAPTSEQVKKICTTLREAISRVEARLQAKQVDEPEFQL